MAFPPKSKYGGVAVEDAPKSKYGGIAVEEEPVKKKVDGEDSKSGTGEISLSSSNYQSESNVLENPLLNPAQIGIEQPNTIQVKEKDGTPLALNTRSIPIVYLGDNKDYAKRLQERIDTGKTTVEDEKIIARNKRGGFFDAKDEGDFYEIANKYNTDGVELGGSIDERLGAISKIENQVKGELFKKTQSMKDYGRGAYAIQKATTDGTEYREQLSKLNKLKDKLAEEKALNETAPAYLEAMKVTDESGSNWERFKNSPLSGIVSLGLGVLGGIDKKEQKIIDKIELPTEFSLGLLKLKYKEPVEFERVTRALQNGEAISETQIANITAQGLYIAEKQANLLYSQKAISPEEYKNQLIGIQKKRYDNVVGNKETLRAILADGIANMADEVNVEIEKVGGVPSFGSKVFGHKWNYSDEEIETYGKSVAQAYGIDYNDPRVKDAIKYLQDNEGVMIMQNSIAKNGFVRDLGKGLASPLRGINATVTGAFKSDAEKYAEAQSAGNVNVSEKKLKRIDDSWEGVVSDVVEGTGQFITQVGLAYATSGVIGGVGKAVLGRAGVAALEGDIALADMGVKDLLGKTMFKGSDGLATFITAYGQSYDNYLKQAYNYTADDTKARITGNILAGTEAATALFLSPLEIAHGIANKLIKPKEVAPGILKILNDKAITNKGVAIANALKSSMLETAKVIGAEIGEEEVTQIPDYSANAILNPNSESFKNRNLTDEMLSTAYQTGLSMAVPALSSGAGAYKVNNFTKGTLTVAAQNRQFLIGQLDKMLDKGEISQDDYNQKASIINTAATANNVLPTKDNGQKLTSQEKANYVYSRVSEAVLKRQIEDLENSPSSSDEAVIKQKESQIKKQQEYRSNILSLKPMYFVNDEMVDKKDFDKVMNSEERDNYDLKVENDEATQQKLRDIGGKDIIDADSTESIGKNKPQPAEKKSVEEELLGELVLPEEEPEIKKEETDVAEQPKEIVSKPLSEIKGKDISYNGEIGVLNQSDTGEWILDRGEGESDIIIPVKDKNNPELSNELGIEVLPDITEEQLKEAEKDREQTGYVTSKNGNEFFVSLANPKAENTVGDQVFIKGKNGKLKEMTGMEDSVKLSLINKFLQEKGLPKRTELVKAVEDLLGKAPTQYTEAATPAKKESGGVSGSALKDVEGKKADIERRRQEELNNVGVKQKERAFSQLRDEKDEDGKVTKVRTPEEKLNAVNLIERNVAEGSILTKEEQEELQKTKDELASQGYEVPKILGQKYHEGMKVLVTNSIPDETLAEGEEVITKVLNPQINKDGKMVQTAQIEVTVGTKKGGLTREQWLEEQKKKETRTDKINAKYDAELATLEETSGVSGSALKDVESTAKALEKGNGYADYSPEGAMIKSQQYHEAKSIEEGKRTPEQQELVKAVEDLLAPKVAPTTNTEGETQTTEAQLQEFGVPEQDVKPVTNVLTAMVDGLRKAGLTAAKTVGDWVGIGKGEEVGGSLKIGVDKSKRKLRLYHSSTNIISGDFRMSGKNNSWGVFFSPKTKYSQSFGDMIYDVSVEPKNTLVLQEKEALQNPFFNITKEQFDKYINDGYDSIAWYRGGELTEFIALTNDIIKSKELKYGEKINNRTYRIDSEKIQPLFKDAEAQYRIESGKNIIEAIKDFDGSPRATVALTHEIMHPTVVSIIDGAKEGNEVGAKHTKTIVDEYNKATGKNITQEQLIEGNDKFKEGTTTKEYRAVQEFIAKAWERYHREGGKGFSEGFQKVLDQITKAFKAVYKSLTGKKLTPELRKMFDDILGKEAEPTPQTGKGEGEVTDAEYNDFIDKGKVTPERLNNIAGKVKNQEPLSDREKEIFTDKTSEINKIIASQPTPQTGKGAEKTKELPKVETTQTDSNLFEALNKALSLEGNKNKQIALERLYSGKNAKYTREEVDAALKINSTFDDIVKDMEDEGLLTKECK